MNKTIKLLFLLITIVSFVFSCKKKDSDPQPSQVQTNNGTATITPTPKKSYEKKWVVGPGTNQRVEAEDSTNILSLEFSKDNYVIVLSDSTLLVGTFSAKDSSTLILAKYGTIKFKTLSNNKLVFEIIRKAGSSAVTKTSTPAPYVAESSKDLNFYKTWKVVKLEGNDTLREMFFENIDEIKVTFSGYGTYLVQTKYKVAPPAEEIEDAQFDGTYYYDVNTWKWSDGTHTKLCYGDWNRTAVECNEENQVKVEFADAAHTNMVFEETKEGFTLKYILEVQ